MEKIKKLLREIIENRSGGGRSGGRGRSGRLGGGRGRGRSGGGGRGGRGGRGRGTSNFFSDRPERERWEEFEEEEEFGRMEGSSSMYNYFGKDKEFGNEKEGKFRRMIGFKNFEDEEEGSGFEEFQEKFIKYIEELEEEDPELFFLAKTKLHEMIHGPHFNEELCQEALECICKKYKKREPKFELEEAEQIAKRFGVEFREFNKHDWMYALNVCACIFEDICRDDMQMCARLAYAWLCDRAIPEGKAFCHFLKHLKLMAEEEE